MSARSVLRKFPVLSKQFAKRSMAIAAFRHTNGRVMCQAPIVMGTTEQAMRLKIDFQNLKWYD